MAYFLFIDESGQDHHGSQYEVLAGVAVEDQDVWNLVQALHDSETRIFGERYSQHTSELGENAAEPKGLPGRQPDGLFQSRNEPC